MVRCSLSLSDLQEGQTGTIHSIDISSDTAERLMDLGFVPGTSVMALKHAPMGDPTTYLLRGYRIGLRKSESGLVKVDIAPNE